MDGLLCDFSRRFPELAAEVLERDRHKRRNFREESVTDLLMAALIGFEPFGIRVDFPDEKTTGADMDWEFVSLHPINGNTYFRLYIQAKRAICTKSLKLPKWHYRELDHESPKGSGKGSQAATLVAAAAAEPSCCPLYMFYHPQSALDSATGLLPAVEGVNAVLAHPIAAAVAGGCKIDTKRVDQWRSMFMSLSDLLCWPEGMIFYPQARAFGRRAMVLRPAHYSAAFSPEGIANRLDLNRRRIREMSGRTESLFLEEPIRAGFEVPPATMRASQGEMTIDDRRALKRPRAIFLSRGPDHLEF